MPLPSAVWMEIVVGLVALIVVALFGRQRRTRLDKTDLGTVSGRWIAEHRSQGVAEANPRLKGPSALAVSQRWRRIGYGSR